MLALCDELRTVINDKEFIFHFKDVIDYRAMDYYKRRYDQICYGSNN